MDVLPTAINALVVALVGVGITYLTRTQIQDLRRELKEDIGELRQDMRELRGEMRAEIASIRSDLTQIALAVGAQPRPQTG